MTWTRSSSSVPTAHLPYPQVVFYCTYNSSSTVPTGCLQLNLQVVFYTYRSSSVPTSRLLYLQVFYCTYRLSSTEPTGRLVCLQVLFCCTYRIPVKQRDGYDDLPTTVEDHVTLSRLLTS
ncbi:uncharacterized protein [Panulirus ornatus]|uniref:uncharacterized protein n=1 Tax=Panulirus ornatus TaxID=150431 RepID=UPI003A8AF79D